MVISLNAKKTFESTIALHDNKSPIEIKNISYKPQHIKDSLQ